MITNQPATFEYRKEKQIVSPLFNIRWHLPATIILNKKKKSLRQKDFSANKRESHILNWTPKVRQ
ncbi:hypothetical protein, partial [Streptococcus anginosus]|uniref:hypothetical protein n=2 Tax=Streptococcus TaxID=1301 RepID=UPI0022844F55